MVQLLKNGESIKKNYQNFVILLYVLIMYINSCCMCYVRTYPRLLQCLRYRSCS